MKLISYCCLLFVLKVVVVVNVSRAISALNVFFIRFFYYYYEIIRMTFALPDILTKQSGVGVGFLGKLQGAMGPRKPPGLC